MSDDVNSAEDKLAIAIANLPPEIRASVPVDDSGRPRIEIVRALYRHDSRASGEVAWVEVRELSVDQWDAVTAAHAAVYRVTRGLDAFPSFAWGDLQRAREELLRQLREQTWPHEWMGPLIEYRIAACSTALKLYQERMMAEAKRIGDKKRISQAAAAFSATYDGSFGYRLLYAMRNAFQHGVGDLLQLRMNARLSSQSPSTSESEAQAYLKAEVFASSRCNAAVRHEVSEASDPIDLFVESDEAFVELRRLHDRLVPLIHPDAPIAAALIVEYMRELGGERAHFHEYVRGLPSRAILGITSLDRTGFAYTVEVTGGRAEFNDGPPPGVMAVLPQYSQTDNALS